MKTRTLTLLGLAAATQFALAADPIAEIGNETITSDQILPYLENITPEQRAALKQNPGALNQTVRLLILQQVLLKEAQAAAWDKQPDVVADIERLRQRAIAEGYLRTIAKVPDSYPSAAELQAAYDARKGTLLVPRQFQLAQIYISAPKTADKATDERTRTQLDTLNKKLKASGADFAAIARETSEERQTSARGGEIGWIAEAQLQPEIRTKLGAKGSLTEPIRLGDGWYVVKVLDIRESRTPTFDEVKAQLSRAMKAERFKQNQEAYLAKLQQQNPMSINELALSKLLETAPQ